MRIGFMSQPFDRISPPVDGGSLAMWTSETAKICSRRGHKTIVFGNHGGVFREAHAIEEEVEYIDTPTGWNKALNRLNGAACGTAGRFGKRVLPRFASSWRDLGYAMEVGRRARELRLEILQIMNYSQFVPVIRKLHPQCRIVLHMHCEWLTQLDRKAVDRRISRADLIIGCSEYITRSIEDAFPRYGERCVTVPNAAHVPVEGERVPPDPDAVLFVGRLSPEKGLHDLVRAFHSVLGRFPRARLHIVGGEGSVPYEFLVGRSDDPDVTALRGYYERGGSGGRDPYAEELEKEAGEELGKRIFFTGRLPHGDLDRYYERAAVLVNPSLSESFGITPVEAMMHGVPVVGTRVGGMTYTVDHGVTGLLVDPADPCKLADAICDLLGDREKARRMGEAGRRKAIATFSWEGTTDTLLDHFRGIVG